MNGNKEVSRFAERAGWLVTLITFFCGTIFLLVHQEANHREQVKKLTKQFQHSTTIAKESMLPSSNASITVSSQVLPPENSSVGHSFWVSEQLYVMKTEVTKELYSFVVHGTTDDQVPMLFSDSRDVVQFANALSIHQDFTPCYNNTLLNQDCTGWRIPTDNEWMLFASAGQGTAYSGSDVFSDVGWSSEQSYMVGSKPPNRWGMYDMSGGAREIVLGIKNKRYGLLGDDQPLAHMRIDEINGLFAARLVRHASKESLRNQ